MYSNGFKNHKCIDDTSSVGGCYMLPLGKYDENRRFTRATRLISLTKDEQSTDDVLSLIWGNLVKVANLRLAAIDTNGNEVRLFLDKVGFFGDHPALTATTGLGGHGTTGFCSFCCFSEKHSARSGSRMYSASIHSR